MWLFCIQNSTDLDEDDNPCGPAMFMKLGWSTPADDAPDDDDAGDPFYDLFLGYDDNIIDDNNIIDNASNVTSADDTDCSTDSEISFSAPPYSPIGDFDGFLCTSPISSADPQVDVSTPELPSMAPLVATPELPSMAPLVATPELPSMELPTVSTPMCSPDYSSSHRTMNPLIPSSPAVGQSTGNPNRGNG